MKHTNVIFVMVDDMGYGDFGKFSEGNAITPTLDWMVDEGVCLTQCYAAAPVCTPSRAAFLTGRYNHRTGAIDMRELRGLSNLHIGETTIGDVFKENGYVTGLMGKWHNGTIGKNYHPNKRGFDEFVGFRGASCNYYDYKLHYNETTRESDGRYLTDVITDESINFITRHKDKPFFLNIAYNAPHSPHEAPAEDVEIFASRGKYNTLVSTLYGMILNMDRNLARVFAALKDLNIDENTIVFFTSDNGPELGGQGEKSHARYNCGLNGCKGQVFDGGIRVPGVVRWPGKIKPRMDENCFVHGTDWFPTMLAAAGIDVPERLKLDGQNILPQLLGEAEPTHAKRFWQWNRYAPEVTCNAAMRDGKWKLVRPPIEEAMMTDRAEWQQDRLVERDPEAFTENANPPFPPRTVPPPGPAKLFDLEADPGETNDVATQHPKRAAQMLRELEEWFDDVEFERQALC